MNYIINPMWFYWISVVDSAKCAIAIAHGMSVVALIIGAVAILTGYQYEDDDFILGKKILKIAIPITVFLTLAIMFIPSKNTLIEMMIAKNADAGIDALKSATDYVINAIKEVS